MTDRPRILGTGWVGSTSNIATGLKLLMTLPAHEPTVEGTIEVQRAALVSGGIDRAAAAAAVAEIDVGVLNGAGLGGWLVCGGWMVRGEGGWMKG